MVDESANAVLLASDDKGTTWDTVTTRSDSIIAGWHDRVNDRIYFVDGYRAVPTGVETTFACWYITTTKGSENLQEMGSYTDANGYISTYDIIKINVDFYVFASYYVDATHLRRGFYKWVDPNWTFQSGYEEVNQGAVDLGPASYVLVESTTDVYFWTFKDVQIITVYKWVTGGGGAITSLKAFASGTYSFPGSYNQNSIAYDGTDKFYMILERLSDNEKVLVYYSITGADAIELGIYNIVLMLDRNTNNVHEKAFHLTEYKVYQLHPVLPQQLHLISIVDTDAVIIAITDNFLINNNGDMFEYIDSINKISTLTIDHQTQEASYAILTVFNNAILLEKNMFMVFKHAYTTAGSTSEEVIFEGVIIKFDEGKNQKVMLRSPAKRELKRIQPSGSYTKDSDGLISQLITDNNDYITAGTLTDGADLGTIELGGEQTEETLFDDCAEFEGWIWYLNPEGKLYFNNGTTDSTINYTQASGLKYVKHDHVHEEYNKIKVIGAYVDGVQVESVWKEDAESQQRVGINKKIISITFLNTVALCNTAADNLLVILAKDPKKVVFTIRDTTAGYIQVGETITFEYALRGLTIASDQYLITSAVINKQGEITYTIIDELT